SNPTAVVVAVLLVLLFGAISLARLPVQMIPNVEQPVISIQTSWRAAAPEEVESSILEPQEDALRGLPGLRSMESTASRGRAQIQLIYYPEVDLERALIEVMNSLNRVPSYPADANEPVIFSAGASNFSAIAWFAIKPAPGHDVDITSYQDFIDDVVVTRFERVPGIANAGSFGGREREVRITFDPYLAAAHGIEIPAVSSRIRGNEDSTGGFTDVGRRQYTVRFAGRYPVEEIGDMVLAWNDGLPVRLRDVATVSVELRDSTGVLSQDGGPSIAVNAQPEQNVNVLSVMTDLKAAVAELADGPLKNAGLQITQAYDETIYITNSVSMLRNNLLLGIVLAVGVLWWFLRRLRATLIVAVAIPVSLFIAFSSLDIGGRTLNIISLAGLAFAMGMVLDASIVVLENIVRLREKGSSGLEAADKGASQVYGALVASTATTVAIFLPLIFLRDAAGQLFADLAFALAVAVISSLIIALTIIPTASRTWLKSVNLDDPHTHWWSNVTAALMKLTDTPRRRALWIAGLVGVTATLTLALLPDADYLPEGKQNFAFAFIQPPPGQAVEASRKEFIDVVNGRLYRYMSGDAEPAMNNYFMGVFGNSGFMGMRAVDRNDIGALIQEVNTKVFAGFPDTRAFAGRASLFGRLGGGREIEINIQSRDVDSTLQAARIGMGAVSQALPGSVTRPVPGLALAEPELRIVPDDRRIAEAGWGRAEMSQVVSALGDGLFAGEYFNGDRRLDIVVRGTEWSDPEQFAMTPVVTPLAGVLPLNELARIERTAGPNQVRRVDRRRTITLRVTPPEMSLEAAIETLRREVEPAILAALPDDGTVSYKGSADNLQTALTNMARSFALAVIILYLLMSALFRSFLDSLLVVLALPLATVGGVIALRLVNLVTFQPMDLLTMIGFITLMGLVVNNAILLVYQTRAAERDGVERREAVRDALRMRLRPILMSTLTSLFGMLPLLLIPGPGTELYRGLAAVIVGGMSVSAVFTLILLPSLLRLGEHKSAPQLAAGAQGQYAQRHTDL
ncbi:MAG: efflux RND transporter permease subunit, partial [Pseudomonadota bacterium]